MKENFFFLIYTFTGAVALQDCCMEFRGVGSEWWKCASTTIRLCVRPHLAAPPPSKVWVGVSEVAVG